MLQMRGRPQKRMCCQVKFGGKFRFLGTTSTEDPYLSGVLRQFEEMYTVI